MTTDQRLRDVMRAHDHEAPTVVPWPAPTVGRRHPVRTRVLVATCLVAALVAGGTWLLVAWPHSSTTTATPATPVAPLTCPAERSVVDAADAPDHVPAAPTVPGAHDHLVPDVVPESAVVCGYVTPGMPDVPMPRVPLSGSATLTGGALTAIPTALARLPRDSHAYGCTLELRPTDDDAYLIGLTYPDGTVWVAAPGDHCAGSGNGAFRSSANVFTLAATWLADGTP